MFLEAGPCAPLFEPMEKILFDSHTHLNNDTLTEEERAVLAEEIEDSLEKAKFYHDVIVDDMTKIRECSRHASP